MGDNVLAIGWVRDTGKYLRAVNIGAGIHEELAKRSFVRRDGRCLERS
jgi:hypothetical protein